ncbi:MAG: arylsulfatase, partial [Planctomycetota bacterium]
LGYGDLGCYGQQVIQTPHIDQMAKEGMRFRNFYAGSTVCAPSRSVLMTGQHVGLTHVRGNAGGQGLIQTLRESDTTVAEVLKTKGYQTALCGKWGLGEITKEMPDTPGHPNRQGFDFFFGYLSQLHAHNYYPEFLWQNYSKVPLRNKVVPFGRKNDNWVFKAGYSSRRVDYSHDLIMKKALNFIKDSKDDPFFLYLPVTIPHANNEGGRGIGNGQEIPDYGIYQSQPWSDPDKGQAAMITLLDTGVGQIMTLLKELDIDENTLVMFSSDNGHHDEGGHNTETFDPNGPLRGMKRDLYEGGIRVPLIVRWPGKIKPGTVSDHIASFSDFMATAADLSGAEIPEHTTSISFLPTLVDQSTRQEQHEFLYWEFYERGGKQAVRSGNWKAVRMPMFTGRIQLFDLENDLGEANDVASQHPEIVERMTFLMAKGHHPHPNWNAKGKAAKNPPVPGDGQPRF